MKIVNYEFPHSSFLSVEKDMEIITNKFFKNDRLKKLLYYTTKNALDEKNIGEEETYALFGKNIKIVPKLQVDKEVLNYVDVLVDGTYNDELRDPTLKWRGSSNQRVIDVKNSIKNNEITLLN